MEAPPTPKKPEAGDGTEAEDIPSDFFDDFNKADFIEGLSVIDSWDDKDRERNFKSDRPRFNSEAVEKVKDLRELMSDDKHKGEGSRDNRTKKDTSRDDKRNNTKNESPRQQRRSSSITRIDEFIKPGSRRDPNKTNEAIKKDKEEKVKEFLAKSLESSDDLRPPGTELDDYFEGGKPNEKKTQSGAEPPLKARSRSRERRRESPRKPQQRRSPRWSPRRSPLRRRLSRSPKRSPRRTNFPTWRPMSPIRNSIGYKRFKHYSPQRERRPSPRRSPRRHSPRHSPRRSPRRSPRLSRRSRSRSPYRRPCRSRSPSNRDNFLYPSESELPPTYGPPQHYQMPPQFGPPSDYQGGPPPSGYPPYAPAYGGYNPPYDYGAAPVPIPQTVAMNPLPAPVPKPVPVPAPNHSVLPIPSPILPPAATGHIPVMVPAPSMALSTPPVKQADAHTPYDALAKLVAEGKISKEDYLKLAPNKGTVSTSDDKNRVMVLNRCSTALIKLKTLDLPNQLLFNHAMQLGPEPKYIAPKFCSPLKRQAPILFQFTSANGPSSSQQNKHLIDSIIAAVGLEKMVSRPKRKMPKNTKDAACQTTKPFCDVCEIRDATTSSDGSTSIDRDHFCSTVHTQVVEQDLVSSKSVFNPSGSVGDGASMSIAHLTPAQLVSQLAARAKTLKNPEPAQANQYRRNQDYDYNYDNRGGQSQQYQNYSNYRY